MRPHLSGDLEIMNSLQVLVILVWLEFGEVIAYNGHMNDADAAMSPIRTLR